MVQCIRDHFSSWPVGFEQRAAQLTRMMDSNFVSYDLTRPSRDGGRDAIGEYRVGTEASSILIDFALEAKCYAEVNSIGGREISRLISRLRHRQFGVLVTTSFVNSQAYKEVKEDKHPILVIAASDIVEILKRSELNTPQLVVDWLQSNFPAPENSSL
ncbi:restriction endonuclease [Rosistilla oblonga]|uniref:restriction endonuclease n=1 Tax=Rosistilla oblonga TaxID=2527990 RepID=UPI0021BC4097|nr:restriction endonuclease [Rosistilla oblonga]